MARNIEDFIQRDLKAYTFTRAFAVWGICTMATGTGKMIIL